MEWFAEENPVMGGIRGQGIATLLRTGKLDNISVLVRETIQNSWDARLSDSKTAVVKFVGLTLSGERLVNLRQLLDTTNMPSGIGGLKKSLAGSKLNVLIIRDENCQGLGGPTRADQVDADAGKKNRYASFLLNVGASEHSEGDGGQFGYGRSIAYRVSKPLTVVVYTRTNHEVGEPQSRLVASMLSDSFKMKNKSYTGRHWWGRISGDYGGCEPVVGAEADRLAVEVGFNQYEKNQFGTSIMIIDPAFGDDQEDELRYIADSIVWNMWPKMISPKGKSAPMKFEVWLDGKEVPVCDPRTTYPLSEFCQAYDLLKDGMTGKSGVPIGKTRLTGDVLQKIECLNPRFDIGFLSLRKFPTQVPTRAWSILDDEDGGLPRSSDPLGANTHHVAIMRTPELIVDYLSFRESPDDAISWVGVFRTNDEMDIHFKNSEPPTHDAWNKQALDRGIGKTAVGIGLERIKRLSSEFSDLLAPPVPPASAGVAALAKQLSRSFMSSVDIPVPGGGSSGGNGGGRSGIGTKVDFVLSAGQLSRTSSGTRTLKLNVALAKANKSAFAMQITIKAAIAEGDIDSSEDHEIVWVQGVSNKDGRSLWGFRHGSKTCEFSASSTDFPLQVVVNSTTDYAVSIDVNGRRK